MFQRPFAAQLEWRVERLSRRLASAPPTSSVAREQVAALARLRGSERMEALATLLREHPGAASGERWTRDLAAEQVAAGDRGAARTLLVARDTHASLLAAAELAEDPAEALRLLTLAAVRPATTFARARERLLRGRRQLERDPAGAIATLEPALPYLDGERRERAEAALLIARGAKGDALARALAQIGRRQQAEQEWQRLAARGPLSPMARLARSENALARGERASALRAFERLATFGSRDAAAATEEGRAALGALERLYALRRDADAAGARRALRTLVSRFPDAGERAATAALRLGDLEVQGGDDARAMAAYRRVARSTSAAKRRAASLSIGWCLLRANRAADAVTAFESALADTPVPGERAGARWGLARALRSAGRSDDATRQLRDLIAESPAHELAAKARALLGQ